MVYPWTTNRRSYQVRLLLLMNETEPPPIQPAFLVSLVVVTWQKQKTIQVGGKAFFHRLFLELVTRRCGFFLKMILVESWWLIIMIGYDYGYDIMIFWVVFFWFSLQYH